MFNEYFSIFSHFKRKNLITLVQQEVSIWVTFSIYLDELTKFS
jgi:hypothetical protein